MGGIVSCVGWVGVVVCGGLVGVVVGGGRVGVVGGRPVEVDADGGLDGVVTSLGLVVEGR